MAVKTGVMITGSKGQSLRLLTTSEIPGLEVGESLIRKPTLEFDASVVIFSSWTHKKIRVLLPQNLQNHRKTKPMKANFLQSSKLLNTYGLSVWYLNSSVATFYYKKKSRGLSCTMGKIQMLLSLKQHAFFKRRLSFSLNRKNFVSGTLGWKS